MTQADSIRVFTLENCIEPARRRGERFVTTRTGDVHKAMGFKNKVPTVCSALRKFEALSTGERPGLRKG